MASINRTVTLTRQTLLELLKRAGMDVPGEAEVVALRQSRKGANADAPLIEIRWSTDVGEPRE